MSKYSENIARILRSDKDTVAHVEEKMFRRFGLENAMDLIYDSNRDRMNIILGRLGVQGNSAVEIYNALIKKLEEDDLALQRALGNPKCGSPEGCEAVLAAASKVTKVGEGFFLKWQKAEEFLRANPPQNIMSFLGYESVSELLKKEDIRKVFAALRFAEDKDWLNNVFFKGYEGLTPDDFEPRYIDAFLLEEKWLHMAEKFMKKKYHNVSHLKELGVIFVLPQHLGVEGEALRLFALTLHYFHEIEFYSHLFRHYGKNGGSHELDNRTFADLFISSLRGDVLDERLPNKDKLNWMIVQRYLAKDDEHDWRLFEPHVNPEALHWARAEEGIAYIGEHFPGIDLSFWHGLGWVGDFYQTAAGIDVLVSFNLVDTAMSLVQRKEMIKYLYHHQEALWNKIFEYYLGEEEMRNLIVKNFHKGFITL